MPPVDPGENVLQSFLGEVARVRDAGRTVLNLHIGDPEFETPAGIRQAAARALEEGRTHYAPTQGLPSVRRAIADRWSARHHVPVGPEGVAVLPAKFAIYASLLAAIEPGDEVLVGDPSYLFEGPIRLAGGRPVRFPLARDHALDLDALSSAVTPRARVVILVTPGNPTGRVHRRDELRAVGEIAHDHGLTVLSDETYADLVYDGAHVASASVMPNEVPVVTVGSFSKTYAMTGWRAGFALAPPDLLARIVRVAEHTITCIPPFVQLAGQWALEHGEADADRLRETLRHRRDHLLGRLDDLPGISYVHPEGALYVFPEFHVELSSAEFARLLLVEEGVAVAPGIAFGPRGEGHVRITFTSAPERLDAAMDHLRRFLERHGAFRG